MYRTPGLVGSGHQMCVGQPVNVLLTLSGEMKTMLQC